MIPTVRLSMNDGGAARHFANPCPASAALRHTLQGARANAVASTTPGPPGLLHLNVAEIRNRFDFRPGAAQRKDQSLNRRAAD